MGSSRLARLLLPCCCFEDDFAVLFFAIAAVEMRGIVVLLARGEAERVGDEKCVDARDLSDLCCQTRSNSPFEFLIFRRCVAPVN